MNRERNGTAEEKKESSLATLRARLRTLYYGSEPYSHYWRIALIIFDVITIGYFMFAATIGVEMQNHTLDYAIGIVLLTDYLVRLFIAMRPWREASSITSITDVIVIFSLFASAFIDNLGFLRVMRMLRLLRSYHVLRELRDASKWFRRNEEIIHSGINLIVFVFVVSAVVYVLEGHLNPSINNFMDALYFTVTTLTTTGFGDITMSDTMGRFLTILIMIFGVALFLRLVQTIFRPAKVKFTCTTCGLSRHDPDAVHCKHCGTTLNIPTEGTWY
ncbi:potassium channel family protein [Pseudovibrio sp. SPO723]|uniref:potassium channel family protein n=1 Tax=Nesiotobacter zosterae TaxID=392721 RepID=UPI0029C3EC1D|nr:ion channel [Pseudovibrio sp. SPO723]MDX5592249.1 ion channel [Pseudovibrio sp. SPO723]